jgi:xylulokinase
VAPDTDWAREHHEVLPDPRAAETYEDLYADFTELYPATRPVVHRLAALQELAGEARRLPV